MKIIFYGTREYDHYYFDVLAADPMMRAAVPEFRGRFLPAPHFAVSGRWEP